MEADQMSDDGNEVSHEKSNNGSIETENDADIYLEKGDYKAANHDQYVIDDVYLILCMRIAKQIHALFSGQKGEDRHN